jgi:hypothetical protein
VSMLIVNLLSNECFKYQVTKLYSTTAENDVPIDSATE